MTTNTVDNIALPANPESERFVLGACLTDAEALQQVVDAVSPEDFFLGTHQVIYDSILRLFHAGSDVDRHILVTELNRRNKLDAAGKLGYIVGLECPRITNLGTYIRHIRTTAVIRRGIHEAQGLIERLLCYQQDSGEMLDTAENLVHILSTTKDKSERPKTVSDIVESAGGREKFLSPVDQGIRIPFGALNKTLMGLRKRRIIFCAARPGVGKTAILQQLAESAASQGYRALVVSAEMDGVDLIHRSMCGRAKASMYRFIQGDLHYQEQIRISQELDKLEKLNDLLLVDDAPSITVQRIAGMLRYQQSIGRPVDVLLIDYVQLLESTVRSENRNLELTRISKALVRIKKQFQLPIFVLAQINRAGAKEDEPDSTHIKECGQFEQDADTVLLLWVHRRELEAEALEPMKPSMVINWKIDKNRGGWKNRGGHDANGNCKNPLIFWKSQARYQEDTIEQEMDAA